MEEFIAILQNLWQIGNHSIALSLFLRLLGAVYFLAFLSLMSQAKGLFGKNGILPARDYLAYTKRLGLKRWYYIPTLFWLNSSDGMMMALCAIGLLAGILLFFGVFPLLMLLTLYVCYLSFKSVGQEFLSFQWDILLLEAGFAGIFIAASGLHPAAILIAWFLFLKFMVMAGAVKLTSKDPNWRNLTAMKYHYETQPLPNPISWHAHHLPLWFHKASVLGMLLIEIGLPFIIFGPPEARLLVFAAEAFLQLAIQLTGNYGPFNFFTAVLAIPLLDDQYLAPLASLSLELPALIPPAVFPAIVLAFVLLNALRMLQLSKINLPGSGLLRALEPFEICNPYGIFAVMTTKRFEIIPEWSNDGKKWHEYEFRWKPQDLSKDPRLALMHMPRLDWLMWFLPFSSCQYNPWFLRFMEKLLLNSPDAVALLKSAPADPPRFVRALAYEYEFTDQKTRKRTKMAWSRKFAGEYAPPMSLRDL
ncbi:MAG: lipase maturation factor family protein [Candidatus Micrarchaeota archaeon]